MKTLLIVESPAKSKTIEKLLGPNYTVLSSFGHIRNLDKKSLGIDVNDNFKPHYRILTDRSKQIKAIENAIKTVDKVLLASDEDREGEAIAWHCAIVFKLNINETNRICFHEITKTALEHAVSNPRKIDMAMVYSQQARRILDRIVGFKLSPLLWKYIAPKLSAGRVQSAALKIIVDKEKEINTFSEKIYYKTSGQFSKKIMGILNHNFTNENEIIPFLEDCKKSIFKINEIEKNRSVKNPPPPYVTSTIQQDLSLRFGLSSKKIMSILQNLYENGFITYHRTDSTNLSDSILDDIKKFILEKFDKKYLHIRKYKSKIKCAQEAHEAIRPTNINNEALPNTSDEMDKLVYNIIWKRTIASQMSESLSDLYKIIISISNRKELFIAKAEKIIFDGYKKIYDPKNDETDSAKDDLPQDFIIDSIKKDDILTYTKITSNEKYENSPPRYNEGGIVKKLEKSGIGRPSTYSNIIETIIDRKYVEKKDIKGKKIDVKVYTLEKEIKNKKETIIFGAEKKKLIPTDLGINTNDFLEKNFPDILDTNFTSTLEENLDSIANNNMIWNEVVNNFYSLFIVSVNNLTEKEYIPPKKRHLGNDLEGNALYAYIGKYGPVIQIGDGKDIKYCKVDSKYNIDTITLNEYLAIEKFPKNLGTYLDKTIYIKNGAYGFYISHDEKNYKLLENLDSNLTLEDAIKCIEGSVAKSSTKIDNFIIKEGQYGPYIIYNNKFYKIPKKYDLKNLNKKDCEEIIKIKKNKN